MIKQIVNIVEFQTLYNILSEVKSILSFNISNFISTEEFLDNLKKNQGKNSIIITKSLNNKLLKNREINKKNIIIIEKTPISLEKLVEKINIQLIKQKFDFQSNIVLKDYTLDLNSRIITKNKIDLKLTEKEVDILVFFKENKDPQPIDILQSKVWQYSTDLETHTVETHIYRLRKKMIKSFEDHNFIKHDQDGYFLNE